MDMKDADPQQDNHQHGGANRPAVLLVKSLMIRELGGHRQSVNQLCEMHHSLSIIHTLSVQLVCTVIKSADYRAHLCVSDALQWHVAVHGGKRK